MNKKLLNITNKIRERSAGSRNKYLELMNDMQQNNPPRHHLSCGNLAHAIAGCSHDDKTTLKNEKTINLGIINSYNDMLSAHKTYENYPLLLRDSISLANIGGDFGVVGNEPAPATRARRGKAVSRAHASQSARRRAARWSRTSERPPTLRR